MVLLGPGADNTEILCREEMRLAVRLVGCSCNRASRAFSGFRNWNAIVNVFKKRSIEDGPPGEKYLVESAEESFYGSLLLFACLPVSRSVPYIRLRIFVVCHIVVVNVPHGSVEIIRHGRHKIVGRK